MREELPVNTKDLRRLSPLYVYPHDNFYFQDTLFHGKSQTEVRKINSGDVVEISSFYNIFNMNHRKRLLWGRGVGGGGGLRLSFSQNYEPSCNKVCMKEICF